MSLFKTAMENMNSKTTLTTTWNGAISLETPDSSKKHDGIVSLFFKTIRGLHNENLYKYLEKSCSEDLIDTFVIAFHVRDCRGGKGERDIGRIMLEYLLENYPVEFQKILHLIPEYGRYDDLLYFFPSSRHSSVKESSDMVRSARNLAIQFVGSTLNKDYELMNEGKPISLCSKWVESESSSENKIYRSVDLICNEMNITKKEYRKKFISPLRSYLNIVEKLMCQNKWKEIDFDSVPSCAIKRLKNAFEKHTPEEFKEWKKGLASGKTVVKAKQLFPHEIIREIREKGFADEVTNAQWKVIEDEVSKLGSFEKTLSVVDTSSSMHSPKYLPLDIACALGLLISKMTKGEFRNSVITFHEHPTFVNIPDGSLMERYSKLKNIPWGGSTNIEKMFKTLLDKSLSAKLTQADMPERIVIVSDMQFNSVTGYGGITNFKAIDNMYKESGYKRPNIVFLNVNGQSTDFPVEVTEEGTVLISGASPSILKALINSKEFDTMSIIKETINDARYDPIRKCLTL
jgi:hypothetical protein